LVVTHPTTNSPACGLSTAERTGSPVFHTLWSYVFVYNWGRNGPDHQHVEILRRLFPPAFFLRKLSLLF
ncbi:hypothetical protein ACN38_g12472, partial [Penicillium nordicum]